MTTEPTRFVGWNIAVALSIYGIAFIGTTAIAAIFGERTEALAAMIGVSAISLTVLAVLWRRMEGHGGKVEAVAYLLVATLMGADLLINLYTLVSGDIR